MDWTHSREQVAANVVSLEQADAMLKAGQATGGSLKQFTNLDCYAILAMTDGSGYRYMKLEPDDCPYSR